MTFFFITNLGFAWGAQSGPAGIPATDINLYDDGAALLVDTLTDVTGLTPWVDYIPVAVVSDTVGQQWRVNAIGFIPVIED